MYESSRAHPTISSIQTTSRATLGDSESTGKTPPQAGLVSVRENGDAAPGSTQQNQVDERGKRRRERYADQRKAAEIYRYMVPPEKRKKGRHKDRPAGQGVTACGWTAIAGKLPELWRTEAPKGAEPGSSKAFYKNLGVCDLRWVCPCCTIKRSEECREQLNRGLAVARKKGLVPVMLTLTARHTKSMPLADYWSKLHTAEYQLKKSHSWKQLNKREMKVGGFAKAVETTYGERFGWHPHYHLIMMLDVSGISNDGVNLPDDATREQIAEAKALDVIEPLRAEWLHQLCLVGLDGTSKAAKKHSFHAQGAAEAADYVSKWGAAEEMTLNTEKVGKAKGKTPWQLLREARTAETDAERKKAASLWWEFVQNMKGVHQLRQSPAFRALVAEFEEQEQPKEEVESWRVMLLGEALWEPGRYKRLLIREATEAVERNGDDFPKAEARREVIRVINSRTTDADVVRCAPPEADPGPLIENDTD